MQGQRQPERELTFLMVVVMVGGLVLSGVTIAYAVQLTTNDSGSITYSMRSWSGF